MRFKFFNIFKQNKMQKGGIRMLSTILTAIGSVCSTAVTSFTWLWSADEPKDCPKSLLK